MKLTTRGRYAVAAMLDLAIQQPGGPVTLKSIAENQKISLPYLEQLFAMLRRGKLVKGTPGPGGGYVLARGVDRISIADIVVAVDEPLNITQCGGREDCYAGQRCRSHDLWSELSDRLYAFLNGVRLGELMRGRGFGGAAVGIKFTPQINPKFTLNSPPKITQKSPINRHKSPITPQPSAKTP